MDGNKVSHSSSKTASSTMSDVNIQEMVSRSYQAEIVEQAKSENLVVCLPTGSGKTFIAVMLIKEWSPALRPSLVERGKRTIFLVKTVQLAQQHYHTMVSSKDKKPNPLDLKVGIYTGSSKIRLQDSDRWKTEFENHHILIFTGQLFLNLLTYNRFSLDKVNLLIFDECHHATGDDPYARIMNDHYRSCPRPPRILGLTASISGQKIEPDKLQKAAKDLETIFQARIETGSDRTEIAGNSTSVEVKYQRCLNYEQKTSRGELMNIFKEVKSLYDELDKYLTTKKNKNESENNRLKITDPSSFIQFPCRTLDQLKSHFDNIIHIGYDLGLYGFSLGIKSLRGYLRSTNPSLAIIDPIEKDLYNKIINRLDSIVNDNLTNLTENRQILYSGKVIQVEEYIKKNQLGQTIVFVERVYTAVFLCQVLEKIFDKSIRIKYLAGSNAGINGISVSAKYQREVVKEFRDNDIHVLISTAVTEEGLDVKACSLVIRFNKPQNFSSYMQSKGRARAKEKALFVLLCDENNLEEYSKNKEEYGNYEYMEKILKRNFKTDGSEDSSTDDDFKSLEPYRPEKGVKIGGTDAVRIIYQYCAVLGNGQILSPRFCFCLNQSNQFKCILSMPGNCPIREDVTCDNKNKKVAKQKCCLEMVKILHQINELDQSCLPIRPERYSMEDDSSDDEETEKTSIEMIDKQISNFPPEYAKLSTLWHLYRIHISDNDDLGFVVPCEVIKLPIFQLYGRDNDFTAEIVYLKPIDFEQYEQQLTVFCRYIFEQVFDNMNTGLGSILRFDLEHSSFKLLPCLLKKSGDIDCQRMAAICDRKNKLIQNPSELNDYELYCLSHLPDKQFYMNISEETLLKRASDPWDYKRKLVEHIKSYADHFEFKVPNTHIHRDYLMATMKNFGKLRVNYLNNSSLRKEKQLTTPSSELRYYPIELLRYAPLNQIDIQLIYKLPSILTRISQLYYIEQLRQILADNIQSYPLLDVNDMPIVTFGDFLLNILPSSHSTVLPLISLNYNLLSVNNCEQQPSPNLLFQSITRHSAAESTDMENLEILGDCFLKLAMSMSLYHQYPSDNAGKLTSKKDKQVSNENLYRLAMKKELKNYLNFDRINFGRADANWLPPGYITDEENSDKYLKQKAKRKAFADMIEGLIGAFLISTNYSTTLKFMKWLGLDVIPTDEHRQTPSILYPGLSDTMPEVNNKIEELFDDLAFDAIEKEINYIFKNKAYLIAAFTHPSYCNNRLTQCYERLEYIGDAVLDFLVIRCIFIEHYNQVTPSRVTNIRQDLANNGRLAYLLVYSDLQTKILYMSPYIFNQIMVYRNDETLFPNTDQLIKDKLSNDIDQWADSTAPKALADVFEALVGAIFLDSGYSLETVWKIIEPLLRQYIDRSVQHPILNPVRAFFERGGKIIERSKDDNGHFICRIRFPNGGLEFNGYGRNNKLAKYDACRQAMKSS